MKSIMSHGRKFARVESEKTLNYKNVNNKVINDQLGFFVNSIIALCAVRYIGCKLDHQPK